MKTLFVISLVSFCVLAWAAFSVARHVRTHAAALPEPLEFAPPLQLKRTQKTRRRSRRKQLRVAA